MLFTGLLLTLFIGLNLNTYLTTRLGVYVRHTLRDQITKKILNTSYETISSSGNHKIYAALTKDINDISSFISTFPFFMHQFFVLMCCIGFMAYKSLMLFLTPCLIFTLNIIFMSYLMKKGYAYYEGHRKNIDAFNADIKTMVEGSKELSQSYSRNHSFYTHHALPSLSQLRNSDFKQEIYSCLVDNWSEISTFLSLGSVLFIHLFFNVGTSADVLTFTFIFFYIQGPIGAVTYAKEAFIKAKVGIKSINNLGLGEIANHENKLKQLKVNRYNNIVYKNMTYHYTTGNHDFSIQPIDFYLNKNEIVFLRGQNGSGKSTFSMLLTGLFTPHTGQVRVDSKVVNSTDMSFKSLFGVVHTQSCLFKEVINQEGEIVNTREIIDFLKLIKLDHKVKVKDGLLSTLDLSQGQKKRLALLLAYFENTPILVLDEFAADQDPSFRRYFYEYLIHDLKAKGKTVLAITHDDAYFHHADRLFVMDNGQLIEDSKIPKDTHQLEKV
tara:strand:+ start:2645 stop:4132 length:1488 start_codon:yes stop_codon:yes gene_type:complete